MLSVDQVQQIADKYGLPHEELGQPPADGINYKEAAKLMGFSSDKTCRDHRERWAARGLPYPIYQVNQRRVLFDDSLIDAWCKARAEVEAADREISGEASEEFGESLIPPGINPKEIIPAYNLERLRGERLRNGRLAENLVPYERLVFELQLYGAAINQAIEESAAEAERKAVAALPAKFKLSASQKAAITARAQRLAKDAFKDLLARMQSKIKQAEEARDNLYRESRASSAD